MPSPESLDFGPPLKLATRQQLAAEMMGRDDGLMSVCAFQLPDGRWDAPMRMSDEFGDPPNVAAVFLWLAEVFKNPKYLPCTKDDDDADRQSH